MTASRVDFPQPLGPTMETKLVCGTCWVMSLTATTSPAGTSKTTDTFSILMPWGSTNIPLRLVFSVLLGCARSEVRAGVLGQVLLIEHLPPVDRLLDLAGGHHQVGQVLQTGGIDLEGVAL